MFQIIKFYIILLIYLPVFYTYSNNNPHQDVDRVLLELIVETNTIYFQYNELNKTIEIQLDEIRKKLISSNNIEEKVNLLILKDQLQEQIKQNNLYKLSDINKIRYLKGLQIIKILYEKTLSLDHHFSTVISFNEINKISNPNYYPEFNKVKELINNKQDKKMGFDLTAILGSNIYTSTVHSLISLFANTNTSKAEKESNLKDIECILDFTLRMHNDLNTIYFETAFLQKSNDNIMKELERLFTDFTKPIKYTKALSTCRNNDDWDSVRNNLQVYLKEMNNAVDNPNNQVKAHKMQINISFPIDRLLQFITQYNAFINQGAKFYEKFAIMLDSYENEQQCASKIPIEYTNLKENIAISIDKFNTAYRPIEINGSKMKEVLYGINEYE